MYVPNALLVKAQFWPAEKASDLTIDSFMHTEASVLAAAELFSQLSKHVLNMTATIRAQARLEIDAYIRNETLTISEQQSFGIRCVQRNSDKYAEFIVSRHQLNSSPGLYHFGSNIQTHNIVEFRCERHRETARTLLAKYAYRPIACGKVVTLMYAELKGTELVPSTDMAPTRLAEHILDQVLTIC